MKRRTSEKLSAVCDRYALTRGLRTSSTYQFKRVCDLFDQQLERPATVKDLTDETVSRFLAWMQDEKYSKDTVHRTRARILSVWRDCAMRELAEMPRFVRKVPKKHPCPIAWTERELELIANRCLTMWGNFRKSGIPRWLYFSTLYFVAFDTGLRRSDLWALRRDCFRADGVIVLPEQQKTGWPHIPQVTLEVLNAIALLPGDCPLAWPHKYSTSFYKMWHRYVIKPAGVRPGALHQIRRSGATLIAKSDGIDAARRYLAHRTDSMVWHYVDRSVAFAPAPMPPRIKT